MTSHPATGPVPPPLGPKRKFRTPTTFAIETPLTFFLENVVPPLRHGFEPAKIAQSLLRTGKRSSAQKPITLKKRWKGCAQDPAYSTRPEEKCFAFVEKAVQAVIKAAGSKETTVAFHNNPTPVMTENARDWNVLPDAYLSRNSGREWSDIVAFGEYHKGDGKEEIDDNVGKVIGSMKLCMSRDLRRRFVFSFTVENTNMKLWFLDRSHMLVSEPFNFVTDHIPMIHFFLSIIYAEPQEIGLDVTMKLLDDGRNYDIAVQGFDGTSRTYRTQELFFSQHPSQLINKVTRVWAAVRVENGQACGDTVVLKDCWTGRTSLPEPMLLEKMHNSPRPPQYRPPECSLFVHVEDWGAVFMGDTPDTVDCTRRFNLTGIWVAYPEDEDEFSSGEASEPSKKILSRQFHHRFVFKDVCTPMDDVISLDVIFRGLARIALALQYMHVGGWVHCDLSPGNILFRDNGGALLGDLEFAKCIERGDDPGNEYRLGTDPFRAVEVDVQRYKFRPNKALPPPPTIREMLDAARSGKPIQYTPPENPYLDDSDPTMPTFHYNPLHDLESLWWIAVSVLITKEVCIAAVNVAPEDLSIVPASQTHQDYAAQLFEDPEERCATMVRPDWFMNRVKALLPVTVIPMLELLDELRRDLVSAYSQAEEHAEAIEVDCIEGMHGVFHYIFEQIADCCEGLVLRDFKDPSSKPVEQAPYWGDDGGSYVSSSSAKRSRSELENSEEMCHDAAQSDVDPVPPAKRAKISQEPSATVAGTRSHSPLPQQVEAKAELEGCKSDDPLPENLAN